MSLTKKKSQVSTEERSYAMSFMEYKRKPNDLLVQVQAIEGRNLAKADFFGKSDPYLCVYVANEVQPRTKTKIIKGTLNPQWNEMLEVYVEDFPKTKRSMNIRCEIYDWDKGKVHDFLGQVTVSFRDYEDLQNTTGKWVELWLPLQKRTSKDKVSGELHLGIRCSVPPKEEPQTAASTTTEAEGEQTKVRAKEEQVEDVAPVKEEPFIDPARCTLEGDNLVDGVRVNEKINFKINPFSQFGDPLATNPETDKWVANALYNDGKKSTSLQPTVNHDGTVSCVYKPTVPGEHKLAIYINGKELQQSPYPIMVAPSTSPQHSELTGAALSEQNPALKPIQLKLQAKDDIGDIVTIGGDKIEAAVTGPENATADVTDNDDGTYTISYVPTKGGTHSIEVKINGTPLVSSPHQLEVKEPADPSQTEVETKDKARVGVPLTFKIRANDKSGNLVDDGAEDFRVEVLDALGKLVPGVFIRNNKNGIYDVTVLPSSAGRHNINIKLRETPVKQFKVNVSGASAKNCVVSGAGLLGADIVSKQGIPVTFTVKVLDSDARPVQHGGDDVKVEVERLREEESSEEPARPAATVTDNGDGTYTSSFEPTLPGNYEVKISVAGEEVAQSPFIIPVAEGPADPTTTTAFGPGVEKAYATIPARFTIHAKDAKGRDVSQDPKVDIALVKPNGENESGADIKQQPSTTAAGHHAVEYTPKETGRHILKINSGEKPIVDSPFYIDVLDPSQAPDPEKCIVTLPSTDAIVREPVYASVQLVNSAGEPLTSGGDSVTVSAKNEEDPSLSPDVEVLDAKNGKYRVKITPKAAGTVTATINVMDKPIAGTPFKLNVTAAPTSSRIVIRSFVVQCRDEQGELANDVDETTDKVTVRFVDEKTSAATNNICHDVKYVGGGKFKVDYVVLLPGSYRADIELNEKSVGSIRQKFSS